MVVIPEETGYLLHTKETPFCYDSVCPCHDDLDNINQLVEWYEDGLASADDCNNIYDGRTI